LTDEQILEIEPTAQDVEIVEQMSDSQRDQVSAPGHTVEPPLAATTSVATASAASPGVSEAPKWLADMMADPQSGGEARDFWQGVQQARQDSTEYRKVFAKPEDARLAAERSRTLDEFDTAFYSVAGKPPEQASAARAALAQRLLQEDPAAFREMVFAGLRAIEQAGVLGGVSAASTNSGLKPGATAQASASGAVSDASLVVYREFEKSANEDLERSVGNAIERTVRQALPNLGRSDDAAAAGVRNAVPLQQRLATAIREDIDAALKGDRQLGEQVAQLLASHRFDDATRMQVVRLINDRAQQLLPTAARRVINSWTQTTLAAHRTTSGSTTQILSEAAQPAARADSHTTSRPEAARQAAREERKTSRSERVDYRKLSDEQILEL
jgi:hypothetical protein